jgi:hypothetical protein
MEVIGTCDGCGGVLAIGAAAKSCRACDMDLCLFCYAQEEVGVSTFFFLNFVQLRICVCRFFL